MAKVNVQTEIKLQIIQLRNVANRLGNAAMNAISKWPAGGQNGGQGRAVKAGSERIYRALDGASQMSNLGSILTTLKKVQEELFLIQTNQFYKDHLSKSSLKIQGKIYLLDDLLNQQISDLRVLIDDLIPETISQTEFKSAVRYLSSSVPPQKIGPVTFSVTDGVLKTVHQNSLAGRGDIRNAEAAREAIISRGRQLLEEITASNSDRKVIEAISDMQNKLVGQFDVIQLGLENTYCDIICDTFEEELSHSIVAKMRSYSIGISQYVAQFPDWVRFTENAASVEFTEQDRNEVLEAGNKLLFALSCPSPNVDPDVPRSIKAIVAAFEDPRRATKRSMFAVIRTIENFVSSVVGLFGDCLDAVKDGTKKGVKTTVSTVVAISLVTLAANFAVRVSPVAERVAHITWMKKAGKLVEGLLAE